MILFFYGSNTFASRQKLHELIDRYKKTAGSEFGLERFDGAEADPAAAGEQIVGAITSVPFLAAHRLIVIEDMVAKNPAAAGLAEKVLPALERVPESTVVIFYERQPDERTKAFKELKKTAKDVKFDPLEPAQLVNWIRKTAQEFNGSIEPATARYLIEQAGTDQWNLYHQLEKLVSFDPQISTDSIDELVEPVFEKTIFDLTEALARGDNRRALEFYQGLRTNKAEPLYILSMIGWALRNLLIVKAGEGKNSGQIAKDAGMNPFVVSKSQAAARTIDLQSLRNAYREIVDTDFKLKTSAGEPDILMEQLIMNITTSIRV